MDNRSKYWAYGKSPVMRGSLRVRTRHARQTPTDNRSISSGARGRGRRKGARHQQACAYHSAESVSNCSSHSNFKMIRSLRPDRSLLESNGAALARGWAYDRLGQVSNRAGPDLTFACLGTPDALV